MSPPPAADASSSAYDERLWVPWWWWLVAVPVIALLGAEFHVGLPLWVKVVTYVVFGGVTASLLLAMGAARIRVAGDMLHAGPAHIEGRYLGRVVVLDAASTRRRRGPAADPAAYALIRSWIPAAVEVQVVDPDDDTPYWLLSSRRPEQLAAAIEATKGTPA